MSEDNICSNSTIIMECGLQEECGECGKFNKNYQEISKYLIKFRHEVLSAWFIANV